MLSPRRVLVLTLKLFQGCESRPIVFIGHCFGGLVIEKVGLSPLLHPIQFLLTGTLSGCILWIIAFGLISLCIFPISMVIGGASAANDFAIRQTGMFICPDNTTPEVYSYASTSTDQYGNRQPSTAYELHCVDAAGQVVKVDPVGFAFLWTGIIAGIGFVISGLLAFALAAPVGILISKLINRRQKSNTTSAQGNP